MLTSVEKLKPSVSSEIADELRKMAEEAEAGRFEAVYLVMVSPDRVIHSKQIGYDSNKRETIGQIELIKAEVMGVSDD